MKKIVTFGFLLIIFAGFLTFVPGQVSGTVYYVDASRSDDTGDGLSWATAFKTVNQGTYIANFTDQIWVKAGFYLPTNIDGYSDERETSFIVYNKQAIYGGFAGGENSLSQRNLAANITILSGDIGTPGDASDNCYNVFWAGWDDWLDGITLDGLTIQDGNANIMDNFEAGGAIYLNNNRITIKNCTFKNNKAEYQGGVMYGESGCNIDIDNCKFSDNTSWRGGAISVFCENSTNTVQGNFANCEFYQNHSYNGGAAVNVGWGDADGNIYFTFINTVFHNNLSNGYDGIGSGGAVQINRDPAGNNVTKFINCLFYGNNAAGWDDDGGAAIMIYSGDVQVYYSTIANNTSATKGGAIHVYDAEGSLTLVNTIIAGNSTGSGNSVNNDGGGSATARYTLLDDKIGCGSTCLQDLNCGSGVLFGRNPMFVSSSDFQLQSCSPAIDQGNNGEVDEQPLDLAGNNRRYSPYGNSPTKIDMGAFEFSSNTTVCSSCIPSSGTLSKSPNQSNVCIGSNVSASLTTKGNYGDGMDVMEYRTKMVSGWSSWSCYNSGDNISTSGTKEVEVNTYRNSSYCSASAPTVANWVVDPLAVGGSVSGASPVCQSCNSTTVTLSGQTGLVQNWQYSTDSAAWNTISGSTGTTYTANNLNVNTWYRASVLNGTCPEIKSAPVKLTMFTPPIFQISGKAQYDNNPLTPLNGMRIVLSKKQGSAWVKTDSTVTDFSGNFTFGGLANAVYRVEAKSAHPSGQWQTWSGVNNTDALLVLNHVNNTALLPANPPVVRITASVKVPHPDINTPDYTAIRQAAKYGWGYFDIPKWVFSGVNTSLRIDSIPLCCADVTRNVRGLCAGDVNGTYLPGNGYKIAQPGLSLVHDGETPVAEEMVFPVRLTGTPGQNQIGAITLYLDYNPSVIEITDVTMPENGGEVPVFDAKNGILYVGWVSSNPIQVAENQSLILIHARMTDAYRNSNPESEIRNPKFEIRFALNENPMSELADDLGNVVSRVKLSISDGKQQTGKIGMVSVYPVPARDMLNLEFESSDEGVYDAILTNMQGVTVLSIEKQNLKIGWNSGTVDLSHIQNGAYLLKLQFGDQTVIRKVIVSR